ncbi:MAG: DNA polymerase III subunit delta [Planctomycetota bacterium]
MAATKKSGAKEVDPPTQIARLALALQSGVALPRGVLVRGDERYFREQALALVRAAGEKHALEIAAHDAHDPDFDLRALASDLAALPMFSSGRLIVLRNAGSLLKKESAAENGILRALVAFLSDTTIPGALVVDAESLRADHALAKATVAAGGVVLALRRLYESAPPWNPDPRQAELVRWILDRARALHATVTVDDALYLAAATGNDLFGLDRDLVGLAQRKHASVRTQVGVSRGAAPWEVADALCRGDLERALMGVESLFRFGFVDKGGARETDRNALLAIFFASLRSQLRTRIAAGARSEPGERSHSEWTAMFEDAARVERKSRSGSTVDANDVVLFATRWCKAAPAAFGGRRGR